MLSIVSILTLKRDNNVNFYRLNNYINYNSVRTLDVARLIDQYFNQSYYF